MVYRVKFSDEIDKSLKKLRTKDRVLFERIQKKTIEIIENSEHYKHLTNFLAGYSRIQFGPFVLKFKIEGDIIKFLSLDHHDNAY